MKIKTSYIVLLVLFISSTFACLNQKNSQKTGLTKSIGFVNDFASVLSQEEKDTLNQILTDFSNSKNGQIAIVSTDSLYGYPSIDSLSLSLAKTWGVGHKKANNGVVITFSLKLRGMNIQVANGLSDKLTNQETKQIIDSTIFPEFKKGNYYLGLKQGTNQIIKEITE